MRLAVLTVLFGTCGQSALAAGTLCVGDEEVLFSCPTSKNRIISVCAKRTAQDAATLFYRFGTSANLELALSANTRSAPPMVEGNQAQGARGFDHFVRFKSGEYTYTVREFWSGCPMPGQTKCPADGNFAGVLIGKAGRVVAKRACGGPAVGFRYESLSRLAVPLSEDWPQ